MDEFGRGGGRWDKRLVSGGVAFACDTDHLGSDCSRGSCASVATALGSLLKEFCMSGALFVFLDTHTSR